MKGCLRIVSAFMLGFIVLTYVTVRVHNQFLMPVYTIPVNDDEWYSQYMRYAGLNPDKEGMFRYQFRCGGRRISVIQSTNRIGLRMAELQVDDERMGYGRSVQWEDLIRRFEVFMDYSGRRLVLHTASAPVEVVIRIYPDWYGEDVAALTKYKGRSYYAYRSDYWSTSKGDPCVATYLQDAAVSCVFHKAGIEDTLPKDAPEVFHEIVRTFEMR